MKKLLNKIKNLQLTIGIDITIPVTYKGNQYFFHVLRIIPGIKYYSYTVLGWRKVNETPRALFYAGRWETYRNRDQYNMCTLWGVPVLLFRLVFPYKTKLTERVK